MIDPNLTALLAQAFPYYFGGALGAASLWANHRYAGALKYDFSDTTLEGELKMLLAITVLWPLWGAATAFSMARDYTRSERDSDSPEEGGEKVPKEKDSE